MYTRTTTGTSPHSTFPRTTIPTAGTSQPTPQPFQLPLPQGTLDTSNLQPTIWRVPLFEESKSPGQSRANKVYYRVWGEVDRAVAAKIWEKIFGTPVEIPPTTPGSGNDNEGDAGGDDRQGKEREIIQLDSPTPQSQSTTVPQAEKHRTDTADNNRPTKRQRLAEPASIPLASQTSRPSQASLSSPIHIEMEVDNGVYEEKPSERNQPDLLEMKRGDFMSTMGQIEHEYVGKSDSPSLAGAWAHIRCWKEEGDKKKDALSAGGGTIRRALYAFCILDGKEDESKEKKRYKTFVEWQPGSGFELLGQGQLSHSALFSPLYPNLVQSGDSPLTPLSSDSPVSALPEKVSNQQGQDRLKHFQSPLNRPYTNSLSVIELSELVSPDSVNGGVWRAFCSSIGERMVKCFADAHLSSLHGKNEDMEDKSRTKRVIYIGEKNISEFSFLIAPPTRRDVEEQTTKTLVDWYERERTNCKNERAKLFNRLLNTMPVAIECTFRLSIDPQGLSIILIYCKERKLYPLCSISSFPLSASFSRPLPKDATLLLRPKGIRARFVRYFGDALALHNAAFARVDGSVMNMSERDRQIMSERREIRDILRPKWIATLEGKIGKCEKEDIKSIWPTNEEEGIWCVVEMEMGDGRKSHLIWPVELCLIDLEAEPKESRRPLQERDGNKPSSLNENLPHVDSPVHDPLAPVHLSKERQRASKSSRRTLAKRLLSAPITTVESMMDAGGVYIEHVVKEKDRDREREKESIARAKAGRNKTPVHSGVVNGVVSITPLSLTDSPDVVMATSGTNETRSSDIGDTFMGFGGFGGTEYDWMDGDVDMMKEFSGLEEADFDYYNDETINENANSKGFTVAKDDMEVTQVELSTAQPLPPTPMLPDKSSPMPTLITSRSILGSPTEFTLPNIAILAASAPTILLPEITMRENPVPPPPIEKVASDLAEIALTDPAPSDPPVNPSPASIPSSKEELPIMNRKQDVFVDKPPYNGYNGYQPNGLLIQTSPLRRKRASSTDGRPFSRPRFPVTFSPPRNSEHPLLRNGSFLRTSPPYFTDPKWTRANGLRERESAGRKLQKITHGGMSMQKREPIRLSNTTTTFSRQPSWITVGREFDELDMRRKRVEDKKQMEQKQKELIMRVGDLQLDESEDSDVSDYTDDAVTFASPPALNQTEIEAQMLSIEKLSISDHNVDPSLATDIFFIEQDAFSSSISHVNRLAELFPFHSSFSDEFLSELVNQLFTSRNIFRSASSETLLELGVVPSSVHAVQLVVVQLCNQFFASHSFVQETSSFVFSQTPKINIAHQDWTVKLSSVSLRFWENIQLQPLYGPKIITGFLILEQSDVIFKTKAKTWLSHFGKSYTECFLGHLDSCSNENIAVLPPIDNPNRDGYLSEVCSRISAISVGSVVIFLLQSPQVVELAMTVRKLIGSSNTSHISILNRDSFMTSIKGIGESVSLTIESAAKFRHLSFSTYDQISLPVWRHTPKRLSPLFPEPRPREIIDLTHDTEDGPRITEDQGAEDRNGFDQVQSFYHPSFTLSEDDPNTTSVFGERTKPFLKKLYPTPPVGVNKNEGRVLFVAYCILPATTSAVTSETKTTEESLPVERLLICWEDDRGEGRDYCICRVEGESWLSYNEEGVAVRKKLSQERERVETVWKKIRTRALENSDTAWRTVAIVRKSCDLGWLEMKAWITFSKTKDFTVYERPAHLTLVSIDDSSFQHFSILRQPFVPSSSISPADSDIAEILPPSSSKRDLPKDQIVDTKSARTVTFHLPFIGSTTVLPHTFSRSRCTCRPIVPPCTSLILPYSMINDPSVKSHCVALNVLGMFQNKIFGDKFREEAVTVDKIRRDLVGKWNALALLNQERKNAGLRSGDILNDAEGGNLVPKFWEVIQFFAA